MTPKEQSKVILEKLKEGIHEKDEVIALTFLTAIAGESIFLLGPPGVAKSLIARRLKFAFKDNSSFEYLMNRFSTPDEIFGPVSISKLKDQDKFERVTAKYLPASSVVFLDEIWKAGPSIQNALLTVINEKVFRNGEQEIKIPLKALISASNELPARDEGLEALWDRFLIRYLVEGIKDQDHFNEMISSSFDYMIDTIDQKLKITDELFQNWSDEIDKIEVPENVLNVISFIRSYIAQYNQKDENKSHQIYISDRRWKKIIRILKTSAFLNDRKSVDLMDCFIIKHCIWDEPGQYSVAEQMVKDAIEKHGYSLSINLSDLRNDLKDFDSEVKTETNFVKESEKIKIYNNEYYYISGFDYPLIRIADYNELSEVYKSVFFYSESLDYNSRRNRQIRSIKLSNKPNHIVHDGNLQKLDTQKEEKMATKKPHPAVKKEWDSHVKSFLTKTNNLKIQINHYKENDLKHLRTNLFVESILASIVESNLQELQKEIEKLEIEVNRIKYYYENIEDQTEQKPIKELES